MIGDSKELEVGKSILKLKKGEKRSWLIKLLAKITANTPVQMKQHKCKCEETTGAASFNTKWIEHYKWDLTEALARQAGTMIDPGSEFRDQKILHELWESHEHWPKMKDMISNGLTYPLAEITEEERNTDLKYMMERGNHKLAQTPI